MASWIAEALDGLRLLGGFHPLRGAFILSFLFCVEATDGHVAENGAGIGGKILQAFGSQFAAATVEGIRQHDFKIGQLKVWIISPRLMHDVAADILLLQETFEGGDGAGRGAIAEKDRQRPEAFMEIRDGAIAAGDGVWRRACAQRVSACPCPFQQRENEFQRFWRVDVR